MHDLNTIKRLNREAIAKTWQPGTPPVGATPTTTHDALIASTVQRKRERHSHPPIFVQTLRHHPALATFAWSIARSEAAAEHKAKRKQTFGEAIRESFTGMFDLDEGDDRL